MGESTETITYDVLGNERHKAVCELRKLRERDVNIWNIEISIALGLDLDASNDNVCDRLIYLLGGDEPNFTEIAETIKSGDECEDKLMENGENHKIATIADELRECVEKATKTYDDTLWHEMGDDSDADHTICHITEGELLGIADRIEEQFVGGADGVSDAVRGDAGRTRCACGCGKQEVEMESESDPKTPDIVGNPQKPAISGDETTPRLLESQDATTSTIERLVREHTLGNLTEWELVDQLREAMDGRR